MKHTSVGSFIAALRKAEGMTQKQLAEMLKVSDKTISRWERDETSPDLQQIPVIADIFGITSDELLRGERARERKPPARPETEPREQPAACDGKREQCILNEVKSKFAVRGGVSLTVAVVGLLIAAVCMEVIQLHYHDRLAIAVAIAVCACVGGSLVQIVSAVSCVTALNREGMEREASDRLKRRCVYRTMLIVGGIVELFVLFALYAYGLDWYEMLPLAPIWMLGAGVVCFGVCTIIEKCMIARGCKYLES